MPDILLEITKGSPLLLTGIAFILLSNPSLAIVLILDYLVFDPMIRYLIHTIIPNFHLPTSHIGMHMVLLTYAVFRYLRSTKSMNMQPTLIGFASKMSSDKMKLILLLVIILTTIAIYNSDYPWLEIAVAAGIGISIGLIYLFILK